MSPRSVKPGFVKRWLSQGIFLILRAPFAWCLVSLMWILGSDLVPLPAWNLLFGIFMTIVSVEMACTCDYQKITGAVFIKTIRASGRMFVAWLNYNKFYVIFFVLSYSLLSLSLGISPQFRALSQGYVFSLLAMTSAFLIMNFSIKAEHNFLLFWHPLYQALGESSSIEQLCMQAKQKNPNIYYFFIYSPAFASALTALVLPYFSIFITLIYPCMVYFAFREIFWGIDENKKQAETPLSQMSVQM